MNTLAIIRNTVVLLSLILVTANQIAFAATPLFVESVEPIAQQPISQGKSLIWYDDFDGEAQNYGEVTGQICETESFGGNGKSLLQFYAKGKQGEGNRKVFFGDSPMRNAVRRGEKFNEVYWRVYIKHQTGWTGGGPDKLSRATTLANANWAQGMIAHVWSTGETLTLDPATGIKDNVLQTKRYNDFPNLRWLGNKPTAKSPIFATENAGRWICVEARAKLNTPGRNDGEFQLWIDGRLESQRTTLNWHGTWNEKGINAVFLEAYWNNGSPVDQSRFVDLFVIATDRIGPVVVPRNPVFLRTKFDGVTPEKWFAEVATESGETVWKSNAFADNVSRVAVDLNNGTFCGPLENQNRLAPNTSYYFRVRGGDSSWSEFHQNIITRTVNE